MRTPARPLTDDERAIAAENYALCVMFARKFAKGYRRRLDRDELLSAGGRGLTEAVRTYDPAKGSFGAHAFIRMRSVAQRDARQKSVAAIPDWVFANPRRDPDGAEHARKVMAMRRRNLVGQLRGDSGDHSVRIDVRDAVESLPPQHCDPIKLRFFEGESFAEIGRRLGKSRQTVAARCNAGLRLLRVKLASLNEAG